jgi:Sulfotransferase domain
VSGTAAGPPDFVGVGAQRSGTSWWFSLLVEHPDVARSSKELHYFDRFGDHEFGALEISRYHALFSPPGAQLRGEWTPRYMHDFWTPALLARAAPRARLLAILRDPVDRFRSALQLGVDLRDRRPNRSGPMFVSDALERGRYHRQLTRLLDYFPAEQLLVLQYERCVSEPLRWYRHTLSFLGLAEHDPDPAALQRRVGWVTTPALPLAHLEERLVDELGEDVERLAAQFPQIDPGLWVAGQ